jgi:hypothetical protein
MFKFIYFGVIMRNMIIRSTAKIHNDKKKGSSTIYLKKEFVEKIDIENMTELMAEYDTETKEMKFTEL